jgi:hypothetical protein
MDLVTHLQLLFAIVAVAVAISIIAYAIGMVLE